MRPNGGRYRKSEESWPPKNHEKYLGFVWLNFFIGPLFRAIKAFFHFSSYFFHQKIFSNEKTLWQKIKNKKDDTAILIKKFLSLWGYIIFRFFGWGHLYSILKGKAYIFKKYKWCKWEFFSLLTKYNINSTFEPFGYLPSKRKFFALSWQAIDDWYILPLIWVGNIEMLYFGHSRVGTGYMKYESNFWESTVKRYILVLLGYTLDKWLNLAILEYSQYDWPIEPILAEAQYLWCYLIF